MGFLDKLKRAIAGGKGKVDDTKDAAAKAQRAVDEAADKVKGEVDEAADKVKRDVEKADKAVDDAASASDELKKD
jgi:hypothetical protein